MIKIAGCLCVFCAAGGIWYRTLCQRRVPQTMRKALSAALRQIAAQVRLTRAPLPSLLRRAQTSFPDAASFFSRILTDVEQGRGVEDAWGQACASTELTASERAALAAAGHSLTGDEEEVCAGLLGAAEILETEARQWERQRPEEEKRITAFCFSAGALLVILLI